MYSIRNLDIKFEKLDHGYNWPLPVH